MKRDGYILINHNNKSSKKLLIQINKLANYFLKRNYKISGADGKIIKKLLNSKSLNHQLLYDKISLLKKNYALDSSRLYEILGHDIVLYDHFNDIRRRGV